MCGIKNGHQIGVVGGDSNHVHVACQGVSRRIKAYQGVSRSIEAYYGESSFAAISTGMMIAMIASPAIKPDASGMPILSALSLW